MGAGDEGGYRQRRNVPRWRWGWRSTSTLPVTAPVIDVRTRSETLLYSDGNPWEVLCVDVENGLVWFGLV